MCFRVIGTAYSGPKFYSRKLLAALFLAGCLQVAVLSGCGGGSGSSGGSTPVTPPAPSPTFTSISPTTGYAAGGTAVTITGTNFRSGVSVTVGSNAATSVVLVNATTITAVTPAHGTGSADVVIKNSDATTVTAAAAFAYAGNPKPTVSSASPNAITVGTANTQISITGTGYTVQSTVTLDGTALTATYVSPTQMTAILPTALLANGRLARLTVTNLAPGGGSSDTGAAFIVGPALPSAIYGHTATVLSDKRVLICGGTDGSNVTANAEIYDPTTNQITAVSAMTTPRWRHTATLLSNGKVLIAGGYTSTSVLVDLQSAELFDPAAGTFTAIANMATPRAKHTATSLPSGKVLLTGGAIPSGVTWIYSELFDPATNTFTAGPQMASYRAGGHAAVALNDGTVLVLGGLDGSSNNYLATAELYNPATNTFTNVGSMQSARSLAAAVRMADGRVFVSGGVNAVGVANSVEIYTPSTQTFSTIAGQLGWAGYAESATLLADGKVLVTGGIDYAPSFPGQGGITWFSELSAYNYAAIFDPTANIFTQIPGMNSMRSHARTALLPSGNVLIMGGTGDASKGLRACFINRYGLKLGTSA